MAFIPECDLKLLVKCDLNLVVETLDAITTENKPQAVSQLLPEKNVSGGVYTCNKYELSIRNGLCSHQSIKRHSANKDEAN